MFGRAAEAGIAYTQVTKATAELKQNVDYLKLNPKGTVPTWVECETPVPFVLNESNSIVAHIAEEGGLSPGDGRARSIAWQWQEYGETSLQPAGSPVWWGFKFGSGYPVRAAAPRPACRHPPLRGAPSQISP